jgi:DNA-binding PadR family transcriptional regulator
MLETTKLSEGSFRMGPATLYSTIQRLAALSLIDETTGASEDDPRRRYYELTNIGRQLLEAEVQRMNAAVRKANARLVKRPAEN